MDELNALAILSSIPHLGSVKIRLLIQHFGSATAALEASPQQIEELPGFGQKIRNQWGCWKKDEAWKRDLEWADREGVDVVPFTSQSYPRRLFDLVDYPLLLYVRGQLKQCDQHALAVVGTRQASIYGLQAAHRCAQELCQASFCVISGLARGIDTAVHQGALEKGRTVAIIGSGLGNIYPAENKQLAEKIAGQGVLVSEFPMATPPDRQNFPQRNRLVAAWSLGCVLIEAPIKSGAMLTMACAKTLSRPLFALPGRVDQENFSGNHQLIKRGEAQLIENGYDVASHFGDLFPSSFSLQAPASPCIELSDEERALFQAIPKEEIHIDSLATQFSMPIQRLNVLVMSLVLKKAIKAYPGKFYSR